MAAALLERGLVEEVAGETRVVSAGFKEKLRGAPAIVLFGDLQRSPHGIIQLVVRVDGDIFVLFMSLFIVGGDDASHQKVCVCVHSQAKRPLFALAS